jgi:hypothetical protein
MLYAYFRLYSYSIEQRASNNLRDELPSSSCEGREREKERKMKEGGDRERGGPTTCVGFRT